MYVFYQITREQKLLECLKHFSHMIINNCTLLKKNLKK
jgi:hypothetical protein